MKPLYNKYILINIYKINSKGKKNLTGKSIQEFLTSIFQILLWHIKCIFSHGQKNIQSHFPNLEFFSFMLNILPKILKLKTMLIISLIKLIHCHWSVVTNSKNLILWFIKFIIKNRMNGVHWIKNMKNLTLFKEHYK